MADEKTWTKEKIKSRIDENELDLSLCGISRVPVKNMIPFTKVTFLDLSCNKINILPETFSKLINLVQLDLSKNALTELPEDFGELYRLKKLDLLQNHLSELPISIHKLKQLQWLDLKGNPIQEILPNVVGDCLKAAECKICAKNIVDHYENLYSDQLEKERKSRKREQDRLAKQQKDEDVLRQRKRQERKQRQEEKKKLNDEVKVKNTNIDSDDDLSSIQSKSIDRPRTSSCFRIIFYLLLLLLVNMIILSVIYKGRMEELRVHFDILTDQAKTYYHRLKDRIINR